MSTLKKFLSKRVVIVTLLLAVSSTVLIMSNTSPTRTTGAATVEGLSQKELKSELSTLYGITNFSDCLELSDLRNKLATVRDTQPITHGLRYGQLLEIGNKKNPTGLVTIAHGLGDTCQGWEDVGYELARRLPHLLFLLPTAPQRAITVNGGFAMPGWYDISNMISSNLRSGQQDVTGVMQSVDYITSLAVTTCKRLRIPTKRMCFCGFSQGAAVSAAAGLLSASAPPAGVALMSGYLPAADAVLTKHAQLIAESPSFAEHFTNAEKAMRFVMFHGRQDPVVPIGAAKETKQTLEAEVLSKLSGNASTVELYEYNMQHSAVPQEIEQLVKFLSTVLPEDAGSGL